MKITDPGTDVVRTATDGDLAALDTLLVAIQPGVFNLAVRMLGNRADAADATQEILLKVVTHLGGFRSESAFTTWVFQVARNHLLTAATRSRETPEVSLEGMADRLQAGLEFAATLGDPDGSARVLTPEDKVAARQVALGCTQSMLMTLDREQRLVYLLDTVFGLPSKESAQVLGISAQAFRQRLARARARIDTFVGSTCGLVRPEAPCRCERQLPAIRHARAAGTAASVSLAALHRSELAEAQRQFDSVVRMGDAAAVFRAHPAYRAPESLRGAIRAVLRAEGHWSDERPLQ